MADIQTLHSFRCNLNDGPCEVRLPTPLMHQDSLADVFRVAVHRDHSPVKLRGMTVCGYLYFRSTRQTLLLEGALENHYASVTLTADCYAVPGFASLVIQLQDGDVRHTVLKVDMLIKRTGSEELYFPEDYASLAQLMERIEALEKGGGSSAYADVAALAADTSLKSGAVCMVAGAASIGDGGAGLYRIRNADELETATDGDAIILLRNGLVAEKVDRWLRTEKHSFPFTVDEGIQNELLECALSYYRNNSKLIYGNSYTANNMAPGREPWNSDSRDANGNQLMQMDCSSFIELVYSGIPFEASRYVNGGAENLRRYNWGFDWPQKERYYHTADGTQQRMLANDLALYCRDRGWLIEPNEDFSNCQTGDILFFADTNYHDENYYGQIHHVAIFLWNNGYGNTVAMHCQTSDKEHPVTVNCMATNYRGTVCAVARLPLTHSRSAVPENLFIDAEDVKGTHYAGEKRFFLCTGNTADAFQPCTFYTVAAKITQDENQQEQNITFRPLDVTTAIDRIRKPAIVSPDGYYEAHFFVNDNMEIVNSPSGRIALGETPCTGITVAAYVYDQNGNYVEGGCVQTDTTIEWIEMFKGVYHPDHSSYAPSAQRQDKLNSASQYVDLTGSIAPLDALHNAARTREVYFATVRTLDAQEPICGLAIDKNYLLMGWRQSDAFGKQIVFNYASNEVLTRNLYNGTWSDFSDTRDTAFPYPMPMANLTDSNLTDMSTLLAPVDALHTNASNGTTYWATVRTLNVTTNAGIAALNGLPAARVYQLEGWRYHDEYGRQTLVNYMDGRTYSRTMIEGVWGNFELMGGAPDAYTKAEVDAMFDGYITDVADVVGGDA